MKVTLDPLDLRPEFQDNPGTPQVDQGMSTSKVKFEHLTEEAQKVVSIVGRAVFWAWDSKTYNAVYPPKE